MVTDGDTDRVVGHGGGDGRGRGGDGTSIIGGVLLVVIGMASWE